MLIEPHPVTLGAMQAWLRKHLAQPEHFPDYSEQMLKVDPRAGGDRIPFKLNPAQVWLNSMFDAEIAERGFVRALVPKARQLGVSRLVQGRFFHQTTNKFGINTYILTHKSEATSKMFKSVKKFIDDLNERKPMLDMCPTIGYSNARELVFPKLLSNYLVNTAEGSGVGVSTTNHLIHLSEVALYPDAKEISTGLMNTVALSPGTEIIMESTGRGPSGMFYQLCQEAIREGNKGLWRVYFLPWVWDNAYRAPMPSGWRAPEEFAEYQSLYQLDDDQIFWFYLKNQQTAIMNGADPNKIHHITKQEFPITLEECFLSASEYNFFRVEFTSAAVARNPRPTEGAPRILGVDPAIDGGDTTWLADRQGMALGSRVWQGINHPDLGVQADIITNLVIQHRINAVAVDSTGLGVGLISLLRLKAPQGCVIIPVNFSTRSRYPLTYSNMKAQIYDTFRQWLESQDPFYPSIPNDEVLKAELNVIEWGASKCYRDAKNLLHIMGKEQVKELLNGKSPDRLEASALTTVYEDAIIARLMQDTR